MAREHVFVDEWDVDAPQEAVLRDCEPAIGCTTSQHFHNHNWSVKRAIEGLEPYARSHS